MCAKLSEAKAIKNLESDDLEKRGNALMFLLASNVGPEAVPALGKIIRNTEVGNEDNALAYIILEEIGAPAVPELFSFVGEKMKGGRPKGTTVAVFALMNICKEKSPAPEQRLVEPAIQMAYDEDVYYNARVMAIRLLGHLGGEEAEKALEELTHHHGHALERMEIEEGLAREAEKALDVLNQQTSNRLSEVVPKTAEPGSEAKGRRKRAVR